MSVDIHCLICERIAEIKTGSNPFVVAELETCYVVLGDHQFFRGYTLVLAKRHATELHELPRDERTRFLVEMSAVAEAVYRWVKPRKLNYELLGNSEPHLHWHIFPRYEDDPNPSWPVWMVDHDISRSDAVRPTVEELVVLRKELLGELQKQTELRIV